MFHVSPKKKKKVLDKLTTAQRRSCTLFFQFLNDFAILGVGVFQVSRVDLNGGILDFGWDFLYLEKNMIYLLRVCLLNMKPGTISFFVSPIRNRGSCFQDWRETTGPNKIRIFYWHRFTLQQKKKSYFRMSRIHGIEGVASNEISSDQLQSQLHSQRCGHHMSKCRVHVIPSYVPSSVKPSIIINTSP